MKESLTIPELKALAEFFFNAGHNGAKDFERLFDELMLGKYNKTIEEKGLEKQVQEMQSTIKKNMDGWDIEKKMKTIKAIEDLRKFVITI